MVLAMATLVAFLPQAVFGPMIGVYIDRHSREMIMIGADLMIAAAGTALALVAFYMELPVWVIMVVLFIRSIGTAFHFPALNAVTPLLVPKEHLTRCAGYTQSIQSVSFIISPALAALLYSIWDLNAVIAVDVAGALVACIAVGLVSIPKPEVGGQAERGSVFREMKEGYLALRTDQGLFALLWIGVLFVLIFMPISALFPLMSLQYFGGTVAHASVVEIAFSVGMLAGGLLLGVWGGFKNRAFTLAAAILLIGLGLTVSGLLSVTMFASFVVCSAVMGFAGPFYSGVQMALYQERIKPEYLGRVFSLHGSVVSLAMPLGLLFCGVFADQIGVSRWFLLSGVMMLGVAALCLLAPAVRMLDRAETAASPESADLC